MKEVFATQILGEVHDRVYKGALSICVNWDFKESLSHLKCSNKPNDKFKVVNQNDVR